MKFMLVKGDKFELYTPDKLMVYADYDRLVQIIFNITQNAIGIAWPVQS